MYNLADWYIDSHWSVYLLTGLTMLLSMAFPFSEVDLKGKCHQNGVSVWTQQA